VSWPIILGAGVALGLALATILSMGYDRLDELFAVHDLKRRQAAQRDLDRRRRCIQQGYDLIDRHRDRYDLW